MKRSEKGKSYWPFAFLNAAQRLRVASPMRFRAAALIFRRLRGGFGDSCAAGVLPRPPALSDSKHGADVCDLFFNPRFLSLQTLKGGIQELT